MRGKKLLTTVALSAMLFAGCGLKSNEAVIRVNSQNITRGQFEQMLDQQANTGMVKALGINIRDEKNKFMYLLMQQRIVNELIVKSLLDQEIEKRGIKVTNEDVDEAIKEIVDKLGSKEQLDAILKQHGISNADFKRDLKEEVKMKKLAKDLGTINVTDADAKKYYNDNINQFKHPDKVRASHILIAVSEEDAKNPETLKAKEAKANEILQEVKKDLKQFAKIAKENSEDTPTASKGGDLGFFAAKEMVPEFSKAAFSLKPNTVTDKPVKSSYGYHIIMVTDRAAASTDSFDKVKDDIKAYLESQKQIELIDKLTDSLRKEAKIEFVDPSFDPENIQKGISNSIKEESEKEAQQEKTEEKK